VRNNYIFQELIKNEDPSRSTPNPSIIKMR